MRKLSIYALVFTPIASPTFAAEMDAPIFGIPGGQAVYADETRPVANGGLVGNVEGSFTKGKSDLFDLDNKTWALRGSVNYDAGGGFNVQGDAEYGRTAVEDFDFDRLSGTAHAYYRPSQEYAIGAFGQLSRFGTDYFDGLGVAGLDTDVTDKMAGIEGAWFNGIGVAPKRADMLRFEIAS